MTGRIGVIIPMYNVVDYIGPCLESVLAQTIASQVEIYVVDDGSTDGSDKVVAGFARENANVHLLRQNRLGPGGARNLGLKVSKEDFVTFLDADDIIPNDAYEKLLSPLIQNDEIEFSTGMMESFPKKQHFYWQRAYEHGMRELTSIMEAPELIHSGSACNKLFRRSSFDSYELKFPENAHFEDARVMIPLLLKVERFTIIPDVVYLYRKRDQGGSIMDSLFSHAKNYWDYLDLIEEIQATARLIPHEKRRLSEQFSVRGFQGFLLRYKEVIPKSEQKSFLSRSYEVFVDVPAWLIRRNTHNPKHAYPFGLLRAMGKLRDFNLLSADTRLHLVPNKPQLGELKMGEYDTLMRSSGFTVWMESAHRVGKNMVVEGRVSARGLPILEVPAVKIEVALGKRRFPAAWRRRVDRTPYEGSYSTFSASIPLKRWPSGEYFPRIVFSEGDIVIEERTLKTMGFWRNSRQFSFGDNTYTFVSNKKNQIGVQKHKAPRTLVARFTKTYANFTKSLKQDKFFAYALLFRSIYRRISKREVWLVGERWDMAQDNSARLFEYLGSRDEDKILPLYVVDGDSPAFGQMSKFGHVIKHGSISHKLAFIVASQIISAFDTDTYLRPKAWDKNRTIENFIAKTNIKRIFLQHGVTFRGDGVRGLHRMASGYDLVLTASEREREFFAIDLGYGSRAVNLGFPRFDKLEPIRSGKRRKILFAPTWRADLVVPSYSESGAVSNARAFMDSHYYKSIMDFLSSSALEEFLKVNNCELYFLPHYEVAALFESQLKEANNVKIASLAEKSFQEWLRSASIFITDYSSTSFDVALMRTPIIYFGWDPVDEETGQFYVTSYFFYDKDGFGPVAHSTNEVVLCLQNICDNNFEIDEFYDNRISSFFGDLSLGNISSNVSKALLELK